MPSVRALAQHVQLLPSLLLAFGSSAAASHSCCATANPQGCFEAGVFCGEGTYSWADGATYSGGWAENKPVPSAAQRGSEPRISAPKRFAAHDRRSYAQDARTRRVHIA